MSVIMEAFYELRAENSDQLPNHLPPLAIYLGKYVVAALREGGAEEVTEVLEEFIYYTRKREEEAREVDPGDRGCREERRTHH